MASQRARPRNATFQGQNLPGDFPLWGFVPVPLCPWLAGLLTCSLRDKPTLERQSALNSHAWPRAPAGREPSALQPHLQDSSGKFKVLTSSVRIQARSVSGRGHGINLNFSEKTRHFEKNCNCAISKLGSEENICKDKENL